MEQTAHFTRFVRTGRADKRRQARARTGRLIAK